MAINDRLPIQDTVNQQNPESLHFSLFASGGASVKASCFWMTGLNKLICRGTFGGQSLCMWVLSNQRPWCLGPVLQSGIWG